MTTIAFEATLDSLLNTVAAARLHDRVLLQITGEDRVRWLNGMATNSIQSLDIGQGCYNFFLNAQGRIQADGTAYRRHDSLLLETDRTRLPALVAFLDRFIIMDDVLLTPLEATQCVLLAGPEASETLTALGLPEPVEALTETTWRNRLVTIIRAHSPLVPRLQVWSDPDTLNALFTTTLEAPPDALEQLRLLEGTPLYGTDISSRNLPQETGQNRALHFNKGCYLGQEIVERIRSRGNVHRLLTGFVLHGALPGAETPLLVENKVVGELTSAARIDLPGGAVQIGLGYIHREAQNPIDYEGGSAVPSALPFPVNPVKSSESEALLHARAE